MKNIFKFISTLMLVVSLLQGQDSAPLIYAKPPEGLDFIQITDLHLFDSETDRLSNEAALDWSLKAIEWYQNKGVLLRFVVFTGDLGLQCVVGPLDELPVTGCVKTTTLSQAADLLANKLIRLSIPVYFVPGNNDLVDEKACDIVRYRNFLRSLRERIKEKGFSLPVIDLTVAPQETSGWRVFGLNSASFKYPAVSHYVKESCPRGYKSENVATSPEQELDLFVERVTSRTNNIKLPTLIFTHEPEIVDPFRLKVIWDLEQKHLTKWHDLMCGDAIVGVFAGHLHSQNFNLYGTAFTTAGNCKDAKSASTWVAPPLASKVQNPLARQARGLLWVRVGLTEPYQVSVTPLWYEEGSLVPK